MASRVLLKNKQNKLIKITLKNIVITNPYYIAQQAEVEDQTNAKMLYKLLSSANPFISLYQQYLLYAIPSPVKVTRQFVRFVIKCWKKYQSFHEKQKFIAYFFGNSQSTIKAQGNDELVRAVRDVLTIQPRYLDNQKEIQIYAQQFKTSESLLRNTIQSELRTLVKQSKQYNQLSLKLGLLPMMLRDSIQNLQNIKIIHQKEKQNLLEQICKSVPEYWQAQFLFDQTKETAYILTKNIRKLNEEIIPFQDYFHPFYQNQSNLKQLQVQNLAFETLNKLQDYNNLKCPYKLGMNPANFIVIVMKQENIYCLSESKCQINYISPILQHLGLNSLTLTAENKIIFQSRYQPLHKKMDFIKTLQKKISPDKIYDTNNAIKWIIYFDYLFCKLFGKGKTSILEYYSSNGKQSEEYVLDKISDHQYVQNQEYLFHQWTICVLDSLLNDYSPLKSNGNNKEQILSIINTKNLKSIFFYEKQGIIEQKKPQNSNRVELLVKILQLQNDLYFSEHGIRSFFLYNKNLNYLTSQQRYLCLYFLAKLAQLNILLILNLFNIKQKQDIQKIQNSLEKFKNIIYKLSIKIVQNKSKENDKNIQQQRQLYESLRATGIQKQTQLQQEGQQKYLQQITKNIRKQINCMMKRPNQQQNIKAKNYNKKNSSNSKIYFLYVSIFSQLSIRNLVDFILLQKQLKDLKNKLKILTSIEIQDILKRIENKIWHHTKQQQKQSLKVARQQAK